MAEDIEKPIQTYTAGETKFYFSAQAQEGLVNQTRRSLVWNLAGAGFFGLATIVSGIEAGRAYVHGEPGLPIYLISLASAGMAVYQGVSMGRKLERLDREYTELERMQQDPAYQKLEALVQNTSGNPE